MQITAFTHHSITRVQEQRLYAFLRLNSGGAALPSSFAMGWPLNENVSPCNGVGCFLKRLI